MPERQVLNGATGTIVQVRKKRFLLQRTQTTPDNVQVCAQSCKFLPKAAAVAQKLGRFLECDGIATQHEPRFDFTPQVGVTAAR
jgi:hypothetical protein